MSDQSRHLLTLSAQIVAAHAGNNDVEHEALPNMIRNVYNTLAALDPALIIDSVVASRAYADNHDGHSHSEHVNRLSQNAFVHPAYGQTVFGDHLICMEDGLSMKMLKRHLLTVHGLTPDEYRAKWGLPADYPMVAAEYAKLRSSLALQSGLGLKPEEKKRKGSQG